MNRSPRLSLHPPFATGADIAHAVDPTDDSRHHLTRAVCGPQRHNYTTRVSDTISSAVTQINQPTLTAFYRLKLSHANVAVRDASR